MTFSQRYLSLVCLLVVSRSKWLLLVPLLSGHSFFDRGDVVSYQNYVMARMPEIWGKDAAVFNPYRWLKENGENISFSPFSE